MGIRPRPLALALALIGAVVLAAGASGAAAPYHAVRLPGSASGRKLVAYGSSQVLVLDSGFSTEPGSITRVGLDGNVDRSFGDDGTVKIYAQDAVVTADGKILVATSTHPEGGAGNLSEARVTCLLPNGRPDRSFGVDGNADVRFGDHYDYGQAIALATNGDILLAGLRYGQSEVADLSIARLKADGTLDRSFGQAGVKTFGIGGEIEVMGIAATPSGGVLVEDGLPGEAVVLKLKPDGSYDHRFGDGGYGPIRGKPMPGGEGNLLHLNRGFTVLSDRTLLVAAYGPRAPRVTVKGRRERPVAVAVRADGRIDRGYGVDGWLLLPPGASSSARGLAPLPNGGVAVGTNFHHGATTGEGFGAVVFDRRGHLDRRFASGGSCRAAPAGQETNDVTVVGRRPVALSGGFGGPWLLACE